MVAMEQIILDILEELRADRAVDDRALLKMCHAAARRERADKRNFAKRRLLPFYQGVKRDDPERWRAWRVTPELEERLLEVLRMKPRRSASGVATITVITKPWPCGGDCLFCPNDLRMPKSYLHNEPACERAEQNWFDPYLQVTSRLTALTQMGHATDKIELIVLGGTWSDYPQGYQVWFISELFRALNEFGSAPNTAPNAAPNTAPNTAPDAASDSAPAGAPDDVFAALGGLDAASDFETRRAWYLESGFPYEPAQFEAFAAEVQGEVDEGTLSYNRAFRRLYGGSRPWRLAAQVQTEGFDSLETQQRRNESARHRVVGLVIETRPDAVTPEALMLIRRLGCTKVQMGVQTLDQEVLDANDRGISLGRIERAFELLRIFGFKIHAHAMANLLGSTPERDKEDYGRLVREAPFQPDEIKLYPCALIEGTRLEERHRDGAWRPYSEDELLDVLVDDVAQTPPFCRISRMIRDFSSHDIIAGNKKPNLRQLVEARLRDSGRTGGIQEIRFREIGTGRVDMDSLRLDIVSYQTSNTSERFLQWITPDNRIAGFLRLSLPSAEYIRSVECGSECGAADGAGRGAAHEVGRWAAHEDEHGAAREAGPGRATASARVLPVLPGEAMIREVHIYGVATHLGEDGSSAQHSGLGRRLIERACDIARDAGYERINVISAVGTRAYYRRLGFVECGLYQQREL